MFNAIRNNFNLYFFNNLNYTSYNLFNTVYSLFKVPRKKKLSKFLKNYENLGYVKSKNINDVDINNIKSHLINAKKIHKDYSKEYVIDDNLKSELIFFFHKYFEEEIKYFSKYFSSNIFITHAKIFTNYGYSKKTLEESQFFSENYHTDNYVFTYFKLFINLEDVDLSRGPLHFVPKDNSKEFINRSKYKNRYSYNDDGLDNLVFKNVGNQGESIFVNTTQNLHKAGIPTEGKSRTILLFHLNAIPGNKVVDNLFYYNNRENIDIFKNDYCSRYFSKPQGIFQTLKLLKNFLYN